MDKHADEAQASANSLLRACPLLKSTSQGCMFHSGRRDPQFLINQLI